MKNFLDKVRRSTALFLSFALAISAAIGYYTPKAEAAATDGTWYWGIKNCEWIQRSDGYGGWYTYTDTMYLERDDALEALNWQALNFSDLVTQNLINGDSGTNKTNAFFATNNHRVVYCMNDNGTYLYGTNYDCDTLNLAQSDSLSNAEKDGFAELLRVSEWHDYWTNKGVTNLGAQYWATQLAIWSIRNFDYQGNANSGQNMKDKWRGNPSYGNSAFIDGVTEMVNALIDAFKAGYNSGVDAYGSAGNPQLGVYQEGTPYVDGDNKVFKFKVTARYCVTDITYNATIKLAGSDSFQDIANVNGSISKSSSTMGKSSQTETEYITVSIPKSVAMAGCYVNLDGDTKGIDYSPTSVEYHEWAYLKDKETGLNYGDNLYKIQDVLHTSDKDSPKKPGAEDDATMYSAPELVSFTLHKYDETNSDAPIAGVKFELSKTDGWKSVKETDVNGYIKWEELEWDTDYLLKEISRPDTSNANMYIRLEFGEDSEVSRSSGTGNGIPVRFNSSTRKVTIGGSTENLTNNSGNYNIDVNAYNRDKIKLRVLKYDVSNSSNSKPIKDVEFILITTFADTQIGDSVSTDENGYAEFDIGYQYIGKELAIIETDNGERSNWMRVQIGDYIFGDVSTMDDPVRFTVNWDRTITLHDGDDDIDVDLTKENEYLTFAAVVDNKSDAKIAVKKTNELGVPMQGVQFVLYKDAQCTQPAYGTVALSTRTTNSNGIVEFSNLLLYTHYYIKETYAPSPYAVAADTMHVYTEVKSEYYDSNTMCYVFHKEVEDKPQLGQIVIHKTGNKLIDKVPGSFVYNQNPVVGITYGVYRDQACTDLVTEVETEGDASVATTAVVSNLPLGTYYVKELSVPDGSWLVVNPNVYEVELEFSPGVNVSVEHLYFENERITVELNVNKVYAHNSQPVKDAGFTLYNMEDVVSSVDGQYVIYPAGSALDVQYTDENGKLQFRTDLPAGYHYVAVETDFPTWVDATNPVQIIFDTTNENTVVNGKITLTESRIQTLQTGKISLLKKGEVATGTTPLANGQYLKFNFTERIIGGAKYGIYSDAACTNLLEELVTLNNEPVVSQAYVLRDYQVLYVKEIESPTGLLKDTNVYTVYMAPDTTVSVPVYPLSVYDNRQKISVEAVKVDSHNNEIKLEGATMQLSVEEDILSYDGQVIATAGTIIEVKSTDANGRCEFNTDLPYGVYRITEILSPNGYVDEYALNSNNIKTYVVDARFNANEGPVHKFVNYVVNDEQYGNIEIHKKGEVLTGYANNTFIYEYKLIGGAQYNIYTDANCTNIAKDKNGTLQQNLTTNADGVVVSGDLRLGTYYIKEIKPPYGCTLDTTVYTVQVTYDRTVRQVRVTKDFEDTRLPIDLTVLKLDEEKRIPIKGAEFSLVTKYDIYDYTNQHLLVPAGTIIVDKAISDVYGHVSFGNKFPYGTYIIHEDFAAAPYVDSHETLEVELSYDTVAAETKDNVIYLKPEFPNIEQKGDITIYKKGEVLVDFKDGKFVFKQMLVGGAEYTLYTDAACTEIAKDIYGVEQKLVTNENGYAKTGLLRLGLYYFKETKAPYGCVLDETIHPVAVEYQRTNEYSHTTQNFEDARQKIDFSVYKIDEDTLEPIEGATFKLIADEDIYDYTNTKLLVTKDTVLVTDKSDEDGLVDFDGYDLPFNKFRTIESESAYLYVDRHKTQNVIFIYADQLKHKLESKVTIYNDKQYGDIVIEKRGEVLTDYKNGQFIYEYKLVQGAQYGIYLDAACTAVAKDKEGKSQILTTGDNGSVLSGKLLVGTYYVKELKAPYGCVIDTTIHKVEVEFDRTTVSPRTTKTYDNSRQKIYSAIYKVDEETLEPIEGATFDLITNKNIYDYTGSKLLAKANSVIAHGTSGADGHVDFNIELPFGSYTAKEVVPAYGYVAREKWTTVDYIYETENQLLDMIGDKQIGTIKNDKQYGDIAIYKKGNVLIDYKDGQFVYDDRLVPGAVYNIYTDAACTTIAVDKTGTKQEGLTTNDEGLVVSGKLALGTYYVKEQIAPYGCVLDTTTHRIDVNYDVTVESPRYDVKCENKRQTINTSVYKVDNKTLEPIKGATFDLITEKDIYDYTGEKLLVSAGTVIASGESAANGRVEFNIQIPFGKYTTKETTPAYGYVDRKNWTTIEYVYKTENQLLDSIGESQIGTIKNDKQVGDILIKKQGEVLTDYKDGQFVYEYEYVEGAIYNIYTDEKCTTLAKDINNVEQKELTTNDEGYVLSGKLALGTYYVKEIKAPYGCTLDKQTHKVEVKYDITVESPRYDVECKDKRQVINMAVYKIDDKTLEPIKGAKFDLITENDIYDYTGKKLLVKAQTVISTGESAADGHVVFDIQIPFGKYTTKEKKPAYGYVDRKNWTTVEYVYETENQLEDAIGDKQIGTIKNDKQVGHIEIQKYGEMLVGYDEDADEFIYDYRPLKDVTFGIYENEYDAASKNNNYITKIVTDETGFAKSIDLPLGIYYVSELIVEDGLVIDTEVHELVLAYDIGKIFVTDRTTVWNERADIKITVNKVDGETNTPLEGAEFTISTEEDIVAFDGTTLFKAGDVIRVLTTNKFGTDATGDLPKGIYKVTETKAPENYTNSGFEEIADFSSLGIYTAQHEISFTAKNTRQKGKVGVDKTGEVLVDYKDGKLIYEQKHVEGIKFGIYDNLEDAKARNEKYVTTITTTDASVDYSEELELGTYYVVELETLEGLIIDKKVEPKKVTFKSEDEVIEVYESILEFENIKQNNNLSVFKTDEISGEPLEDCTFALIAGEDIYDYTGKKLLIKADEVIETATTNEEGKLQFVNCLPCECKFSVVETKAAVGFTVNEIVKKVVFMYQNEDLIIVQDFENAPIIGSSSLSIDQKIESVPKTETAPNPPIDTGDKSDSMKYFLMLGASVMLAISAFAGKKRKKNNKTMLMLLLLFGALSVMPTSKVLAAETRTETITIETVDEESEESLLNRVNGAITIDGIDYTLSNIVVDKKEDIIKTEIQTTETTFKSEPVFSDSTFTPDATKEVDGVTYTLVNTTTKKEIAGGRRGDITGTVMYYGYLYQSSVPNTADCPYMDLVSQKEQNYTLTLSSVKELNPRWEKIDASLTITIGDAKYYDFLGHTIRYTDDIADLIQYKDEIITALKLDKDLYKFDSIAWDGDEYLNADGVKCRNAKISGQRYLKDYEATYVGNVEFPEAEATIYISTYENKKEVIINETENNYIYTITATYTAPEKVENTGTVVTRNISTVTIVTISIAAIILIIIVILLIISSRNKKKKAEEERQKLINRLKNSDSVEATVDKK